MKKWNKQSYLESRLTVMKPKFPSIGVPDKPGIAYQILGAVARRQY
jgi:hypothetical protein